MQLTVEENPSEKIPADETLRYLQIQLFEIGYPISLDQDWLNNHVYSNKLMYLYRTVQKQNSTHLYDL